MKNMVRNGTMNPLIEIRGSWRLFVEDATGDEAVEWAVRALELGFDGPHLRQLGAFDTPVSRQEVKPVLLCALQELGGPIWTEGKLDGITSWKSPGKMVKGELDVDGGLREIHRTVIVPLSHPKDLQVWCDLLDEFQRAPNGSVTILDPGKRDAVALAEAKKLAESWRP